MMMENLISMSTAADACSHDRITLIVVRPPKVAYLPQFRHNMTYAASLSTVPSNMYFGMIYRNYIRLKMLSTAPMSLAVLFWHNSVPLMKAEAPFLLRSAPKIRFNAQPTLAGPHLHGCTLSICLFIHS